MGGMIKDEGGRKKDERFSIRETASDVAGDSAK
jgi:hypothetical protein